jgi:HK97 family phage major capsid protein
VRAQVNTNVLVPEVFNATLIEEGLESAIVRSNGPFVVPMTGDTLRYPRVNETNRTSTVKGGIVGYWQGEGGTYQESEPVFGDIQLTAKKLIGFTKVSDELLADSAVSLEPFLRRSFAEAWAWFEDIAFLRGTGSGQPLGILNAPALIGVTRQDHDDTIFEDILNVWSRVTPSSRSRAIWLMNHENLPKMLRMHAGNTVTNAYGAQLVWQQNIYDPIKNQIFGRPVIFTEKMSAQGVVGDVGCFDLGQYIIGDRQGLTIDMSNQVYWGTGYIAFKFTERVDGQPMVASAVTPYKGSATLSPFVTLAETS